MLSLGCGRWGFFAVFGVVGLGCYLLGLCFESFDVCVCERESAVLKLYRGLGHSFEMSGVWGMVFDWRIASVES